jgi:hypothetical protein
LIGLTGAPPQTPLAGALLPTGALTPGVLTPGVLTPGALLTPAMPGLPTPSAPGAAAPPLTPGAPNPLGVAALTPITGMPLTPGMPLAPGAPPPGAVPQAPLAPVVPGQPMTLQASPTGSAGVSLNWSPVAGTTTYGVLVARDNRPMVPDQQRQSLTTTNVTIDSLPANAQFTFMVVARDANGSEVSRSNPAPVQVAAPGAPGPLGAGPFPQAPSPITTPYVPPGALTPYVPPGVPGAGGIPPNPSGAGFQLTSNPSDPGAANLQWSLLPNAVSYSVSMLGTTGQWQVVVPSTNNAAAFIPSLTAGQYSFQVRARDANGTEMAASNVIPVTVR